MKVIQKYQVHLKEEDEKKQVGELKQSLDKKITKHKKLLSEQLKCKALSCAISFGTSRTKVLTSETNFAQLHIYNEWKATKDLKKKDLIEKMVAKYGFLEDEIQTKKVAELKQLVEQHLLAQEEELVEGYQKELNKVTILILPSVANVFQHPTNPLPNLLITEEKNEEGAEVIKDGEDDMEKEILSYLNRRLNGEDEEDEEKEAALLSTLFSTLS